MNIMNTMNMIFFLCYVRLRSSIMYRIDQVGHAATDVEQYFEQAAILLRAGW